MNTQEIYKPSSFLALFYPRGMDADSESVLDKFETTTNIKPDISITTKSFIVCAAVSSTTQVAVDQNHQITLILHGQIYNSTKQNQAEFLIEQFIEHGMNFAKDINGSFAILLINRQNNVVALITDRINSKRVFSGNLNGIY